MKLNYFLGSSSISGRNIKLKLAFSLKLSYALSGIEKSKEFQLSDDKYIQKGYGFRSKNRRKS